MLERSLESGNNELNVRLNLIRLDCSQVTLLRCVSPPIEQPKINNFVIISLRFGSPTFVHDQRFDVL